MLILIGQALCNALTKACALIGLELNEHPACGPVDGHEQVAPLRFVLHLGQVLHINVHIAWLVALEGLVSERRLLGLEGIEVAHPMTAQTPIQPRARDMRADEFSRDSQQVIQGQQQGAPQLNHNSLLGWGEHALQAMGGSPNTSRCFHL